MLFSGQDAFSSVIKQGPTLALSTLAFLLLFKGAAWSISLGNFRGGPTFPAVFPGAAAELLAAHLPGFSKTPAVAVLWPPRPCRSSGLPLSATVIALLLTSKAGIATAPLIIVAVVVAYITIQNAVRGPPPARPPPRPPRRPHNPSPPHPHPRNRGQQCHAGPSRATEPGRRPGSRRVPTASTVSVPTRKMVP